MAGGLCNAGLTELAKFIVGEAANDWANGGAWLGVGDSTTAYAANQTNLQAATNKYRQACDATYPQRSGLVITSRATFAAANANYHWQEVILVNHATDGSGEVLYRDVVDLDTKPNTQDWILTSTCTLAAA